MAQADANDWPITVSEPEVAVRVEIEGVVVADTQRARVLREGTYVPRYYLPREDVRLDLLVTTDHATFCPFKGDASYWSVELPSGTHENVVWSYEEPIDDRVDITGMLAFYNERVDLHVQDAADA